MFSSYVLTYLCLVNTLYLLIDVVSWNEVRETGQDFQFVDSFVGHFGPDRHIPTVFA